MCEAKLPRKVIAGKCNVIKIDYNSKNSILDSIVSHRETSCSVPLPLGVLVQRGAASSNESRLAPSSVGKWRLIESTYSARLCDWRMQLLCKVNNSLRTGKNTADKQVLDSNTVGEPTCLVYPTRDVLRIPHLKNDEKLSSFTSSHVNEVKNELAAQAGVLERQVDACPHAHTHHLEEHLLGEATWGSSGKKPN